MRIWSLHPQYLDSKGLVALWRETLLAKKVLEGKTKGYKYHPQLNRFKSLKVPLDAVNFYLSAVLLEAEKRGYHFDSTKVGVFDKKPAITVTKGQLEFEVTHLLNKLKVRNPIQYTIFRKTTDPETHPLFKLIPGGIENWEII